MKKLDVVRDNMSGLGLDAYIVPSEDPHLSEYPPEEWNLRKHISGFTGSAGTLVVLAEEAGLWTDSRYFLQAPDQLAGSGIELFKDGLPSTPSYARWIVSKLGENSVVGIDGSCFSVRSVENLRETFSENGIRLVTDVRPLWNEGILPHRTPLYLLPVDITGLSHETKRLSIFEHTDADGLLLSALDEVAWSLNVRASDTPYNPVVVAYALLKRDGAVLFASPSSLSREMTDELNKQGVEVMPYESVFDYLHRLPASFRLSIDPEKTNYALYEAVSCEKLVEASPVAMLKACKNATELSGFRLAMRKDGVALTEAFSEIYETVEQGGSLSELNVADILLKHRNEQADFVCESFSTIAGYGAHGAIVHYSATESSNIPIGCDSLLLVDSGGNYRHGTTDITRTFCLGTPTDEQRIDYTSVLKGHIAVATAVFPEGTQGSQLDVLAKSALWRIGADYGHGTGHGVGHFLCVHEGPQNIRRVGNGVALRSGMVLSDEPGLYREGRHGIRIENLVAVEEASRSEYGAFFRFETLTLFPYDSSLIKKEMLTDGELAWLNAYHERVRRELTPLIRSEKSLKWLLKMTATIV